ncbi:MAG: DUF1858 domain-containing protein [Anaerovorax sp.]|nr:DUF1858 domain-containing protein [Anaerovorax sp.]
MSKINESMLVSEIMDMGPDVTEIFLRNGLNCLGCPGAATENLQEAAEGHGVDLKALMADLNDYLDKL